MSKHEGENMSSTHVPYSKQTPRTQYVGNIAADHLNVSKQASANQNKRHVTPGNRASSIKKDCPLNLLESVDTGNNNTPEPGLAMPPRPGTARGGVSPTSAYIANYANEAPAGQGQSIASSLKRKSEMIGGGAGTNSNARPARNPYSC